MGSVGNYRILKLLGEGAFGYTYKGEHKILKVPVVLKERKVLKEEATDSVLRKRYSDLFREEAAIIAKLRHPSLPSFMDYVELLPNGGGQIMIISFIEGTPLDVAIGMKEGSDQVSRATKPFDDEHICWVADRIFGALSYLHGKHQIVHCDLKPANVILDIPDHNATVVDMGMASFRPEEWSKAKGGTMGYLPPEFMLGLPPIPASDIYSVGKIMIALAGGSPARGEIPDDMNLALKDFVAAMIRHDPTQRPQSVDLLRHEIALLRKKVWGRVSCQEEMKYRNIDGGRK
ncbi:MAG: serine/threonine-protein kinase [Bacteroidota bacterium]|jgi:serine/threonine-protein kinase